MFDVFARHSSLVTGHLSLAEESMFQHITVLFSFVFTCSLISMPVGNEEVIDMRAFYERHRPVLFSAFTVTYAMSMVANFADRNNFEGWKRGDWIGANLLVLPLLIVVLVAGWAGHVRVQWK